MELLLAIRNCHLDIRTPVAGYQTAPHSGDSSPESAPPHHSYCLGCDLRSYVHEPPLGKAEDAEEARIRRGDEANLLQQQDHFFYFAPKLLGCDRTINAVDNFLVCKSQCDRRLIACDRRPINASTLGGRPLSGLTRQGDDRSMVD
jgi:hypothetical protein